MLAELYYRFKLPLFNWNEERWVRKHFYHEAAFKELDLKLLDSPNPYHQAKVFPYGETPLRVLYEMGKAAGLKPTDHFVDLGCGRGRAVFFMSHVFGCRATGIDLTHSFISRARKLKTDRTEFICQDFFNYDLKDATCIYLYGTTYATERLQQLKFPADARLLTVSEPLLSPHKEIRARFPWGQSTIFLSEGFKK